MMRRFYALLPLLIVLLMTNSAWADEWQDPETKVNYEYTPGQSEAIVKKGSSGRAGSKDVSGDISILPNFNVDGVTYTVTTIGDYAFTRLNNLNSVVIPSTVETIGNSAFRESKLATVSIPNSVKSIGNCAFDDCVNLKSIDIPGSVNDIGFYVFGGCTSLASLTIGEGVTSISGQSAFQGCISLTNLEIPASLTQIHDLAFAGCSGLEHITVTDGNTIFDSRDNCNAVVRTKDNTIVLACKNTTFPNSVTAIDAYNSFNGCSGLKSLHIPKTITSLGNTFPYFSGCSGLESITVDPENPTYDSRNNCNAIIETNSNELVVGCKNTVIPDGIIALEHGAFADCTDLTSIAIPESVKYLYGAFRRCPNLVSVNIPENVIYINDEFYDCTSLDEIHIPRGVKHVSTGAFTNTPWYKAQPDGLLYLDGVLLGCKGSTKPTGKLEIEDGTWMIAKDAFYDYGGAYNGITSISFPASLRIICERAFSRCNGLTSITIPEGVIEIGNTQYHYYGGGEVFSDCANLSSISLPSTVEEIGKKAFQGTTWYNAQPNGLLYLDNWLLGYKDDKPSQNLLIREGTKGIANGAFEYCRELTSLNIPESVIAIGSNAFYYCEALEGELNLPKGLIRMGDNAFCGCKKLTGKIVIPETISIISKGAFAHCERISSLYLPEEIKSIGQQAFYNCNRLTDIISHIQEPFAISEDVFLCQWGYYFSEATLYVPSGTVEKYKATDGWKHFRKITDMQYIAPIEGETTISTEGLGSENLSDNTVGNVYYNIGDDSYDSTDGSIVIVNTTNMGLIDDKNPGSEDIKNNFTGLILKVIKGKGTIIVNVKTTGNAQLVVQVGNQTPMIATRTEQGDVVVSYDVTEDTYVYIYAIIGSSAARAMRAQSADMVKIYGITITSGATDIQSIDNGQLTMDNYYTLDGRKLDGMPTQKGLYIVNGRKVVIRSTSR